MTNANQEMAEKIKEELEGFDLPIDESASKASPRVHVAPGDSACVSCEG
jgi:hypothetical protein